MQEYEDIPLPHSAYGQRLYAKGRRLVEDGVAPLDELVWDADEVLWDWLMEGRRMSSGALGKFFKRDFSHREFVRIKPGVFELIWGMRHASIEADLDPHMRIWTNGYPWRLWRIGREIPGFMELIGPPADAGDEEHEAFIGHPRIFYRGDYAAVAEKLLVEKRRRELLKALPVVARDAIEQQFREDPFDSSFKLPELAAFVEKPGFERSMLLIDDSGRNIKRFLASGRRGIRVVSELPWLLGRVPNTVWREAPDALAFHSNRVAEEIATHLRELAGESPPASRNASSRSTPEDYVHIDFHIDVPDARIRAEWIDPIRRLKEIAGAR